jgi:hypothetical protein
LYKFSPHQYHAALFRINEGRYAIQIKEPLPRAISAIGEGIECIDFNDGTDWGYMVYVGEKDKLISEGVAQACMFPDGSEEGWENRSPNANGFPVLSEKTMRLHAGKWVYLKYPQRIQEAEEVKRSDNKSDNRADFRTPDEYRRRLLWELQSFRGIMKAEDPIETKWGQIYTIDAESLDTIKDAWDELSWAIHDAVIHTRMVPVKLTEEEKAAKRDQYADAQNDVAFKTFVQGLIGNQDALH